jgi:endothelin-converting enzyme/putative endopeptidase
MRRLNASLLVLIALTAGRLVADDKVAPKSSPGAFQASQLDPNIKPCNNFYQYVCHSWQLSHPIPPDRSNYGQGSLLTERNQTVLREILDGASKPHEGRTALEAKVGTFYNSCLNEKLIAAKDLEPAKPYFERIAAIKDKTSLVSTLAYLNREGIPAIFNFSPQPDMDNSDLQVASFNQGGLGLPDRDFYFRDDAKSKETREKYVQFVTNMFVLLGDSPEVAAANARTVMTIETRLADASMDRVSMRNPDNRRHPMTFAELQAKVPALELDTYITNSSVPAVTRVNVVSPKFYEALNTTIDAVPLGDWKSYLRFRVLSDLAPRLPRRYEEEVWSFHQKYLTGAKEMQPRWKKCVIATDTAFGDALGQLYVAKTFGPAGRKRMAELIENLRQSLQVNINQLEWMGTETRAKALKKLAAFSTKKVGYPDKWKDYSSVNVVADDFAGNSLRAYQFERKRNYDRIGGRTDKDQWGMTPPTVNAYYNPPLMEVVFPAGILQPPYFDRFGDDAYNYGGIGSVIGHEFSHGFDDAGRKYDDQGNAKDWWTEADAKAFELRANALADQYSAYKAGGINVNGKLTLGENIGDNGGVRIAYMAYRTSLAGKEAPVLDGLTGDQRFFIGWANGWCNNATDDALRNQIQTNPHAPSQFRAVGPLMNMQEFQKAFDCQKGDAMVPEKPVRVW